MVGTVKFEARIRELVADHPDLAAIVEPLLIARRVLREQLDVLHCQLLEIVRHDEVCRRLMTTPGVGPVVALTFRATVHVPSRFTSSKAVGAAFGLTPRRQQSGEIDRMGGISKCGDALMRKRLIEAALVLMTHSRKWSWLNARSSLWRDGWRSSCIACGWIAAPPAPPFACEQGADRRSRRNHKARISSRRAFSAFSHSQGHSRPMAGGGGTSAHLPRSRESGRKIEGSGG